MLATFVRGLDVLEVGSYCGLSAICMAQVARSVLCVDPFDARGTPDLRGVSTEPEFRANLSRWLGENCGVMYFRGVLRDWVSTMTFDAAFIDGDHSEEAVAEDLRLVLPMLRPDAVLAFHDAHYESVRKSIQPLYGEWARLGQNGALEVLGRGRFREWAGPASPA